MKKRRGIRCLCGPPWLFICKTTAGVMSVQTLVKLPGWRPPRVLVSPSLKLVMGSLESTGGRHHKRQSWSKPETAHKSLQHPGLVRNLHFWSEAEAPQFLLICYYKYLGISLAGCGNSICKNKSVRLKGGKISFLRHYYPNINRRKTLDVFNEKRRSMSISPGLVKQV